VAVANGVSVAGAVIAGYDGVRGWIYHLAVPAEKRRLGIATALMREAEARLSELGCSKVNVQVRAANAPIVGFYTALGYIVEDRLSLGKPLQAPLLSSDSGSESDGAPLKAVWRSVESFGREQPVYPDGLVDMLQARWQDLTQA
jgi:hypothetical protein